MADDSAPRESLLARFLKGVTSGVARSPRGTLWFVLVLCCVAIGGTVSYVRFETDRSHLVDASDSVRQNWDTYREHFGEASDIIVAVEADSGTTIHKVMDDIAARLQREPEHFANVLHKIDVGQMQSKALQFLSEEELVSAARQAAYYRPILREGNWDRIELRNYARFLTYNINRKINAGEDATSEVRQTRLLTASLSRFYSHMANDFHVDRTTFRSPWPMTVQIDQYVNSQSDDIVYLMNDTGTLGFVKVFAVQKDEDITGVESCLQRLREHVAAVNAQYAEDKSVHVSLTGIPVLENDEMRQSQTDMLKACGLAFLVVGALLLLGFRGVRHPMLALLMVIIGVSWTLGLTTLAIGHFNILSISFAVILIGLGIDFAIHYLSRYLQLRHEGQGLYHALVNTSGSVGTGIVTAAVTTALAFLCALATDFRGVAELGVIAGGGILLCCVATFFALPALIRLGDAGVPAEKLPKPIQGNAFRTIINRWPAVVLVFSLLVIGGLGSQAFDYSSGQPQLKVGYDANLMHMQATNLESVEMQERIAKTSKDSMLFAVSMANSRDETLELAAKLEALPTVARVEELASRLPPEPSDYERRVITALRSDLRGLPNEVPNVYGSANPSNVGQSLDELYMTLGKVGGVAAESARRDLDRFLNNFVELPLKSQEALLNAYQNFMASSLLYQYRRIANATNLEQVRSTDLPPELTRRFVHVSTDKQQTWLLKIFPKEDIWEEQPLAQFVEDVRSIDPNVTGVPLQNYEAATQIRTSYQTTALYAVAVISLVLLLDFLRPGQKLMTLVPPVAVVGFVGYTLFQRNGEVDPNLLVGIYLAMVAFIGAVLDFRNLRDMFLSLLPPLLGGAMMVGAMAMLHVDLNPANLIVLPLVLGIGVDDGVHVVHDYRRQMRSGADEYLIGSATINAILLTSLTSMVGFGSLMIASHQGLFSVGLTLLIGVGCCGFVSLIPLPAILRLVGSSFAEDAEVSIPESARERRRRERAEAAELAALEAEEAADEEYDVEQPRRKKRRAA